MDNSAASSTDRQTALVTGASSGIGKELARLLAADGYDLVLVARSGRSLEELASEMRAAHGIKVKVMLKDLSKPGAAEEIFARLDEDSTVIDVLVNNAGFATYDPFAETDASETLDLLALNIVTLTHLTRLSLAGMLSRGRGRILNVASTAAFQPGPLMATYYASKAFVLSFSEALSHELRTSGVTVTALCPGPTRTGFQDRADMHDARIVRLSMMEASRVAQAGYRGMQSGKVVVIPGFQNWLLAQSVRFTPRVVVRHIVGWLQGRTGGE